MTTAPAIRCSPDAIDASAARDLSHPGTLVTARGREWVVLPESHPEELRVKPVGGLDEEIVAILPAIEPVESATFRLPGEADFGDFTAGRLLRHAARLSTRAAAGPFRCFARIAIEPRPYQLVPLMMALRLDPVRLLIADDVGIGKTIEALLIARELLDRGEIGRFAVLTPPHLAKQWHKELLEKFHIDAEQVLSSTIGRLERDLPTGVSVFDRHRCTIVSTDFIKSPRRAEEFAAKCPEFVIVDEAHGCTLSGGVGRSRQQRFEVLRRITESPERHVVLVTATPHSGNEHAFRSLLSLLDPDYADLPTDLDRAERDSTRRQLARHLVQRRRADIAHYLETDTAFPTREDKEVTYPATPQWSALFESILRFANELVTDAGGDRRRRRVRYWSALALLRCVSSSPAAAAATLRSRAAVESVDTELEIDAIGCRSVLDEDAGDSELDGDEEIDIAPGANAADLPDAAKRRLLDLARAAEALAGDRDPKLLGLVAEVKSLLKDGFRPIVFCRFVDTAEYVARELRDRLPRGVHVEAITGRLPPEERERRIDEFPDTDCVLVATDCLSEGINLQNRFDAVVHYDLCWTPVRHEQREGRVDRFGQRKSKVRVLTYYGIANPIDGIMLDVIIRKHKAIRSDLGVAVSVPGSSEQIAQAIFEAALFREKVASGGQELLFTAEQLAPEKVATMHADWEARSRQEKASHSRFAQMTIRPDAVAAELAAVRASIGGAADAAELLRMTMAAVNVPVEERRGGLTVHVGVETPRSLRQAIGHDGAIHGRFDLPLARREVYLGRTSPVIEGVASWVLDQALDPSAREVAAVASRCGVAVISEVAERTLLLVARFRFHLRFGGRDGQTILCEEILPIASRGRSTNPQWLDEAESERLLAARPARNLLPTLVRQQLELLLAELPLHQQALTPIARARGDAQLAAHERVRDASRLRGRVSVQPVLPVDILGAYVLLPAP